MKHPTNPPASPHDELSRVALRVREHVVHMAVDGGCFLGASLSCADLLVHLYHRVLRLAPDALDDPRRDYLFLSKGHDVPALYGTLAERGFLPRERLANHLSVHDHLYWHPNRHVPGVEFHAGSLGHLLSVAIGVAIDIQLRSTDNRVFVVLGDGELDEGSIWEGLLVAARYRLDKLVLVVDRNGFQANGPTEEILPLEPLAPRFEAFGCATLRVDGHSFDALDGAFASLPRAPGRPTVVIADTVRGKGLPSLEARADRWFVAVTHEERDALLAELHGAAPARLASEPRVVR